MATRDGDVRDFGSGRRTVDHVTFEDGTLVVFDPREREAWIECRSPIYLSGRN